MLRAVDSLWVRYLTDLAILREGIGLRAFGQQDPLVAFRREAHDMYQQLLGQIQSQVARATFRTPVAAPRARARPQPQRAHPTRPQPSMTAGREVGTPAQGPGDNPPGRNDPCWCGSGKKYKHCHLRQDQRAQRSTTQDAHSSGASKRRRRRR
jgi:preprotein translocase subunit SecA